MNKSKRVYTRFSIQIQRTINETDIWVDYDNSKDLEELKMNRILLSDVYKTRIVKQTNIEEVIS